MFATVTDVFTNAFQVDLASLYLDGIGGFVIIICLYVCDHYIKIGWVGLCRLV